MKLCASTRLETIREAYYKYIHKIAKDVTLMVEAVNKIVKYRSLFLKDIPNFEALQKHLESFVPVYNQVRPHISLKGLTPAEVLSGMRPDNIEDLKKAGLISSKQSFQRAGHINCTVCLKKKDGSYVKV